MDKGTSVVTEAEAVGMVQLFTIALGVGIGAGLLTGILMTLSGVPASQYSGILVFILIVVMVFTYQPAEPSLRRRNLRRMAFLLPVLGVLIPPYALLMGNSFKMTSLIYPMIGVGAYCLVLHRILAIDNPGKPSSSAASSQRVEGA